MIELIYCADGNRRFAEIAINAGFLYGAQLPNTVYFPPFFVDQNWKRPDRERYVDALKKHKPHMASVLDWERPDQLSEVLAWAEEAAQYVNVVMLIPKVHHGVSLLPRSIGGKAVRLGYSVPTKYGGTDLFLSEFIGWPMHLLGGSPRKQLKLSSYLNVVSADGNYANKMAVRFCEYWDGRRWCELKDATGFVETDAPYEAFRRSCENTIRAWRQL
jgi:hypothetical protein